MLCEGLGGGPPSSKRCNWLWTISWYRGERAGGLSNTGIPTERRRQAVTTLAPPSNAGAGVTVQSTAHNHGDDQRGDGNTTLIFTELPAFILPPHVQLYTRGLCITLTSVNVYDTKRKP